jgi:hypothetical protein
LAPYRETAKAALVHLDTTGESENVVDAVRATAADTDEDMADMEEDEAMTCRALDLWCRASKIATPSGPHTTASPSSVNDVARSCIAVMTIAGYRPLRS